MRKITAALLFMVMLLSCAIGTYAEQALPEQRDPSTLVVGHTTMMNGNFFSDIWGNNSADIDVRSLIHEYPLVAWTSNGEYQVNNTVVRALETTTDGNGDKTFTVTLHDDLYYSDGSPIGAKDYVFNILLMSSAQIRELSGVSAARVFLDGFEEYQSEEVPFLSGIRLLGDLRFSVRVKAENLPYYFELSYINTYPLPPVVLAPGADIADDGEGAYIRGEFTADILRGTLLDSETGYLSHASVTSGPYRLVRYDDTAHTAEFEINPYYKGNYEEQVPVIPRLLFREVKNENILTELANGTVDLINKVTEGRVIDEATAAAGDLGIAFTPYPRSGAGFLAVAAERDIGSSALTRQALAYMLDYEVLPRDFLGGHGERVYGYYGLGQWMAEEMRDELQTMQSYTLDLAKAAELLAQDGWIYNAQGEPYVPGEGLLRHKQFGEAFLPLSVNMAVTERNKAADLVAGMLGQGLREVGGELQVTGMPLNRALQQYYRQNTRTYDLLFLGSNFSYLFDPTNTYLVGAEYQGTMNTSGVQDPRLAELAANITRDNPGNRFAYLRRWMEFQRYWAEVLPMIPLYGNTYYDLYTRDLAGYFPQFYWNWGTAILYAGLNR